MNHPFTIKERLEREAKTQKAAIESGEERLEKKSVELTAREEEVAALNSDLSRLKKVNEKLKKNLKETRLTLSKCQVGGSDSHLWSQFSSKSTLALKSIVVNCHSGRHRDADGGVQGAEARLGGEERGHRRCRWDHREATV